MLHNAFVWTMAKCSRITRLVVWRFASDVHIFFLSLQIFNCYHIVHVVKCAIENTRYVCFCWPEVCVVSANEIDVWWPFAAYVYLCDSSFVRSFNVRFLLNVWYLCQPAARRIQLSTSLWRSEHLASRWIYRFVRGEFNEILSSRCCAFCLITFSHSFSLSMRLIYYLLSATFFQCWTNTIDTVSFMPANAMETRFIKSMIIRFVYWMHFDYCKQGRHCLKSKQLSCLKKLTDIWIENQKISCDNGPSDVLKASIFAPTIPIG